MRRVLFVAALFALLAACSVDVEGAACSTPGSREGCPEGQLCGTNLLCSVAAARCASTPCTISSKSCRGGSPDVMRCSGDADPICGSWVVDGGGCSTGTSCFEATAGQPECRCDRIQVVGAGVSEDACSSSSIETAIAAARDLGYSEVQLVGDGSSQPVEYNADSAPIVIPSGFTVRGVDATPTPANRLIEVQAGSSEAIRVEAGGRLAGVTVRKGTSGPAVGIRVVGGSPMGTDSLAGVRIDALGAGAAFATAVRVEGADAGAAEGVRLAAVEATGATISGLDVAMDAIQDTVTAVDLVLVGNNVGVKLEKGDLVLERPVVTASGVEGVNADIASAGTARLSLHDGVVSRNGTVGLWLGKLSGLDLQGMRVCANTGSNRLLSGETRKVGGLYALGAGPAPANTVVKGNQFFGNGGDQIFIGAGSGWNLSAPGCGGTDRNLVAGYGSAGSVGLAAVGAGVTALNWEWSTTSTPEVAIDFHVSQGGSVDAVGGGGDFCLPSIPPQPPICPD